MAGWSPSDPLPRSVTSRRYWAWAQISSEAEPAGLPFVNPGLRVDQRGDGRVLPHLVQVAAAVRADAADRDAQPGADIGVGQRRVGDEQGDQLLAVRRQLVERF